MEIKMKKGNKMSKLIQRIVLAFVASACLSGELLADTNTDKEFLKGVAKREQGDYKGARKILESIADKNPKAKYFLGVLADSEQAGLDKTQAADLYSSACKQLTDSPSSGLDYWVTSYCYWEGHGVEKDKATAIDYSHKGQSAMEQLAKNGNVWTQYVLATSYANKELFNDKQKAAQYYTDACNGGSGRSCNYIGVMYNNGDGIAQDFVKASQFYSKGCTLLNPYSCHNLAWRYQKGEGVKKDMKKAAELYTKAILNGKDEDIDTMGILLQYGDVKELRKVFANKKYLNMKSDTSNSLLMFPNELQNSVAKLLLELGADVNARNDGGSTPLTWAAGEGRIDLVNLYLQKGADVNAVTNDGNTALMFALNSGYHQIAKVLATNGATLNTGALIIACGGIPKHKESNTPSEVENRANSFEIAAANTLSASIDNSRDIIAFLFSHGLKYKSFNANSKAETVCNSLYEDQPSTKHAREIEKKVKYYEEEWRLEPSGCSVPAVSYNCSNSVTDKINDASDRWNDCKNRWQESHRTTLRKYINDDEVYEALSKSTRDKIINAINETIEQFDRKAKERNRDLKERERRCR
jgi:uncharacterized protein